MNYRRSLTIFLMIILLSNLALAVVYEDAEDENSAQAWQVYDNTPTGAIVSRIFDTDKQSHVIEIVGTGMENGYILGSFDDTQSWNNKEDTLLRWSMSYAEDYTVYIRINTLQGYKYLYYTANDVDYGLGGGVEYIHFGLGVNSTDGLWRTFNRDLEADLKKFESDNELLSVHGFLIRGSGKLDNIEMFGGEDRTKPIITLLGDSLLTVIQDTPYTDAGATAQDNIDGDITANIVIQNSVDITTLGTYTVTYNVHDLNNNQAVEVIRTVSVVQSSDIAKEVLILYDTAGSFGHMGKTNAIFLENLLGHFDVNVVSKPAIEYTENEMNSKKAVFYLGTTYNVLSYYPEGSVEKGAYQKFYRDIATKDRTIVWINYNLPLLEQFWIDDNIDGHTFAQKFGIASDFISQLKYNRVNYKNTELFKGVIPFATPGADVSFCEDEGNNRYACSLELNLIKIVDTNKSEVFATTYSTIVGTNTPIAPYITRGGKLWFVGDIPFSYMSEEDRYLAFSDLLHDMLNIPHKESHKAIMRLEDVDAKTDLNDLNNIANYMKGKNIPFSVATIAQYEDPLGIENSGVPTTELLSDSIIGTRLKELYDEGAIHIVQHGTTHQFHSSIDDDESEIKNPYNGLSGDDFEFMKVVEHADLSYSYLYPIENDSGTWATNRILQGKSILTQLNIEAFAWEAPHYMAGANHYRAIADVYPVQYARLLYFPNENSADVSLKYKFIGQFFPYMIKKDMYGYTVIPENIHNVEDAPNEGYRKVLPEDIIRFAKKLKVVRDGVASFYYHPYLKSGYLGQIVQGLEDEGYEFVSAPSLLEEL